MASGKELLNKQVEILFEEGDGTKKFFLGTIKKVEFSLKGKKDIPVTRYFVLFADGDKKWFDFDALEKRKELKWPASENKKTDDKKTNDKKTDDKKTGDKKTDDKKTDDKKIDDMKTDDKKTDDMKTDGSDAGTPGKRKLNADESETLVAKKIKTPPKEPDTATTEKDDEEKTEPTSTAEDSK